jgi:hypothetical protein
LVQERERQASRNLNVHENVLRKWVQEFGAVPRNAFSGNGQMKPEELENRAAEARSSEAQCGTGHPKKSAPTSRRNRREVRFVAKHRGIWAVDFI